MPFHSTHSPPQGNYILARRHQSLVFTAGMTPRRDGKLVATGKVSPGRSLESYRDIFELACANALAATRGMLRDDEKVVSVLSLTVFIATGDDFESHSQVADFASDYLYRELGEEGVGSRVALGVASLPGDAPVEIQLISVVGERDR